MKNISKITTVLIFSIFIYSLFLIRSTQTYAQSITLGITPPVVELIIQPGKEVVQRYQISNQGPDTQISIYLAGFTPSDELGNIDLKETLPDGMYSWINIVSPQVKLGEKFPLASDATLDIAVRFSPPKDTPEQDHYLTLLFLSETTPGSTATSLQSHARIGSNLLVTVSEDGKPLKKAEVAEFSSPSLVDSLSKVVYRLKIKNTGKTYFKPTGSIIVRSLLGKTQTYEIAPVNVLSSSTRQIPCLFSENLIECELDSPVLLGPYWASAQFQLDNEGQNYTAETTTIALPISIGLGLATIYLLLVIIKGFMKKNGRR